ncbi:UDP-glucosyltransferase 2-like [Leptidea sinapis]|uniref:UDP-glucosyltransferase 2-like n=1 Tax=Leptidea sinapis TaxID=189913 RepID=UPI0021465328|nr:UDP-glucosyltransferase 2-like [Leptidea sinapis]
MAGRLFEMVILIFLCYGIEAARILAWFPTPSISHQIVFRPIIHELARRGHEVKFITPDPVYPMGDDLKNLTQVDVHDISYANWQQLLIDHRIDKQELITQIKNFLERFTLVFDKQLEVPEVQRIVKEERNRYDLILTEACVRVGVGLSHIFKVPVALIGSFGIVSTQYSSYGAPIHPFLYPTPGRLRLYNLSTFDKISELINILVFEAIVKTTEPFDYMIMTKHFGDDIPTFDELYKQVKLVLVNEHPLWADNHPVGPNIKYIGGVHQSPQKELPKDLKNYLDASKNGVIYISFGTNVKTTLLPQETVKLMNKVFSELPYNVLWKWDSDLPGRPSNVKISEWFPQADLLRHPNVKLFITQGGLQSTDETITAGVPVIGMPVLGDQWYNVEKYVHHKIGLQLDLFTLKEDEFKSAIETIITDPSFKKNILRLRDLMRDVPIQPLDNAVWWIEHVINFGGDHLTPPAAGMSWFEYYELPLVLTLFSILLVILLVIYLVLIFVIRFVKSMLTSSKKLKLT